MEKYLNDKRIKNTWEVVKIEDLPDNMPIIVVQEFPTKNMAAFCLHQYCIVPKGVMTIITESQTRKK